MDSKHLKSLQWSWVIQGKSGCECHWDEGKMLRCHSSVVSNQLLPGSIYIGFNLWRIWNTSSTSWLFSGTPNRHQACVICWNCRHFQCMTSYINAVEKFHVSCVVYANTCAAVLWFIFCHSLHIYASILSHKDNYWGKFGAILVFMILKCILGRKNVKSL